MPSYLSDSAARQAFSPTSGPAVALQAARSAAAAAAAWEDAGAGAECSWPSAAGSGWYPTSGFQVSGGRMYANGSGPASGATLAACPIPPSQNARGFCLVNVAGGSGSNGLSIGVSTDAPGAVPAAGQANAYTLQFTDNGHAYAITNGNPSQIQNPLASPGTTPFPAGEYLVTIEVDEATISVVGCLVGSTDVEVRANFPRPAGAALVPFLFNSDSAQLAGNSVGPYSFKAADAGGRRGFGVTPLGKGAVWTVVPVPNAPSGVTSVNLKVQLPFGHDSRVPCPLMFFCHGYGGSENDLTDEGHFQPISDAFVRAGYIVASPSFPATRQNNWGSQATLDGYAAAYRYVRDHFSVGPVVLVGSSMGGIDSLALLADRTIPNIVAWIGKSPSVNFFNNYIAVASGPYANGAGGPNSVSMETAYGATVGALSSACAAGAASILSTVAYPQGTSLCLDPFEWTYGVAEFVTVGAPPSGTGPYTLAVGATANAHAAGARISDLPSRVLGNAALGIPSVIGPASHDPSALPAAALRGVPILVCAATDDATVCQAENGFALAAAQVGTATESFSYPGITGGHTYVPSTAVCRTMLEFADKYAGR